MRALMVVKLAVVVLGIGGAVPAFAADEDRLLGHSRAAVEAAFPNLPKDQLDLLVFRIPTFSQIMANAEAISADAVDPFANTGLTRMQLAAKYPAMPSSEIDRLAVYLDLIELRRSGN